MRNPDPGSLRKWLGSEFLRMRTSGEDHWFLDEPDWPSGYCADTCIVIAPGLRDMFTGKFTLMNGRFGFRGKGHESTIGHTWIIHEPTGIYVDPTIGQFTKGEDYDVITPNHPLRTCYYFSSRTSKRFKGARVNTQTS